MSKPTKREAPGATLEAFAAFTDQPEDRFTPEELARRPPPPQLAAGPFVPRRQVAFLVGSGGVGKGQLLAALAVSKVLGGEFFGYPLDPEGVIFWSAEDERGAIHRSLHPLIAGLPPKAVARVAEGLVVKATVGRDVKLTRRQDGAGVVAGDVDVFIQWAQPLPNVGVVILDTTGRLNGLDESNEGLALVVQAAERIAVALDVGVILTHHTGKGQMRAGTNDQYTGRGGSAASDNARSVMVLAKVAADDPAAPTNAADLIAEGRLLRLSHVKANYTALAPDLYLERVIGPAGPWLRKFNAAWDASAATASTWSKLEAWLADPETVNPTKALMDALPSSYGSRAARRAALEWALDHGAVAEVPHPRPQGARQKCYRLVRSTDA